MAADQPPSRGPGRPRTSQNPGTARGELARWLCEVADREPRVLNSALAAHAGVTTATVGRALRGETFASPTIVAAVVELGNLTDLERQLHLDWVAALADLEAKHGKAVPDAVPAPPWNKSGGDADPRPRRRRLAPTAVVTGIGVVVLAAALVVVLLVFPRRSADRQVHIEQVANHTGTPTFADPIHGTGATGARIPALMFVDVSCKLYAPIFPSVQPDGYWYRIESPPWNGQFYAVANTFANGDPPGSAVVTNTDRAVPDC